MTDKTISAVDFSALVLGFSSASLSYMGYGAIAGGSIEKNLTLAKQNIEIIELLQEKTKGNLDEQEEKLVKGVLADLKAKFVEAAK